MVLRLINGAIAVRLSDASVFSMEVSAGCHNDAVGGSDENGQIYSVRHDAVNAIVAY